MSIKLNIISDPISQHSIIQISIIILISYLTLEIKLILNILLLQMQIRNIKSESKLRSICEETSSGSDKDSSYQSIFKEEQFQIDFLKRYNMMHSLVLGDTSKQTITLQSPVKDKLIQSRSPTRKVSISTMASTISSSKQSSAKSKTVSQKSEKKSQISLKDFKIGKHIGSGRFSDVFIVKNIKVGFVCALKRIKKVQVIQQNMINQLIRQIKIQLYCDHPNLLKLYGLFDNQQFIFLITQLCSQGELYNSIQKRFNFNKGIGCFNDKQAATMIKQIVQGVRYMHTLNIIHRDLKPENILVERGVLKICDFGWAVHCKIQMELRSTFCGTPLYVSPEVVKGEKYDKKIDLWAIGIMAYEIFYGRVPFELDNESQLDKIVKDELVFPKVPKISDNLKNFIEMILKKNPKQRFSVEMLSKHPYLKQIA